tara:strand:+ start:199 stop:489 length:291 start_codon:yes stop_codon:yes gene_type:complete
MNTARLKNIFLGIIAINLTLITLIQLEIFPPKAYANEINTSTTPINTNYGLVPLNEDGSIDVNVVSEMDVYLKGYKVNNQPLTLQEWALDVEVLMD